jgi:hypothetical protein
VKPRTRSVVGALLAVAVVCTSSGAVSANGAVQREIQGRLESVDAASGRVVVVREFRGRTWRVELTAAPGSKVYICADERAGLDRVRAGVPLGVFYEVVGSGGIANAIVIEPGP